MTRFFFFWFDTMDFSTTLLGWYLAHARDLPWRNTTDPYHIWVSEVILQQTRVAQGISYYHRFIERFPTIESLANANIDDVMKVWQGLGYYTRARNLKAGAIQVMEQYNGSLPKTYKELLQIKGLGAYSAAAIASFAFGEPVPAVDGNVYRILSRVYGVFTSIDSTAGKKEFFALANELIPKGNAGRFNQAIIDFGALQCTPKLPRCIDCPFAQYCYANQNNLISTLPVRGKKKPPVERFFYYFLIRHNGFTYIKRREEKDIWHSLYEFPLLEVNTRFEPHELIEAMNTLSFLSGSNVKILDISHPVRHMLSHRTLWATFIILEIDKPNYVLSEGFVRVPIGNVTDYSLPRLIDSYMAAEPVEKYFSSSK